MNRLKIASLEDVLLLTMGVYSLDELAARLRDHRLCDEQAH